MNPMEGMSPEDMQVMMELIMQGQTAGAEQKGIDRQLKQAEAMRGQAPQMVQGGRVQTAPHWLDVAGSLGTEYAGNQMGKKAEQRQKDLGASTAAQNQKLLELLGRMQQQKAAPPPMQPVMPGAGGGINPGMPMGQGMRPSAAGQGLSAGMAPPFAM
jgi:hypothetical protein